MDRNGRGPKLSRSEVGAELVNRMCSRAIGDEETII